MLILILLAVLVLLEGKDVLIEVLLEFLVGKINVELFKSIHFEILESENVEYSDKGKLVLPSSDSHVDSLQNPPKQVGIDTHRRGVTRIFSLEYKEVVYLLHAIHTTCR
jgi:hypothetical protein